MFQHIGTEKVAPFFPHAAIAVVDEPAKPVRRIELAADVADLEILRHHALPFDPMIALVFPMHMAAGAADRRLMFVSDCLRHAFELWLGRHYPAPVLSCDILGMFRRE